MSLKLHFISRGRLYGVGVIAACLLLAGGQSAVASAPAIAQNFRAGSDKLIPGALASTEQGASRTVQLSIGTQESQMVGVIAEKPLVSLGNEEKSVEVVTSGITSVLVSDLNGSIEAGDKITASPIKGVGMKATEPTIIAGTAQSSLAEADTKKRTITTSEGDEQTVRIGRVPVDVSVTFFAATEVQQEFLPPFLQETANAVAGKPVSPVRVIAAIMVLVLAIISVAVLLYSSVRSSIISIGRNPLSEKAVHKSLLEVGFTVIGVLLLSFITVYLILVT